MFHFLAPISPTPFLNNSVTLKFMDKLVKLDDQSKYPDQLKSVDQIKSAESAGDTF